MFNCQNLMVRLFAAFNATVFALLHLFTEVSFSILDFGW
jgi:hypothetical protein